MTAAKGRRSRGRVPGDRAGAHSRRGAGAWAGRSPFWAALLLVSGCAAFFKAPSVSIVGLRLASVGLEGGTASLELEVTNPNARTIRVNGVDYSLQVQEPDSTEGTWSTLSQGGRDEVVTLAARDSARVTVDIPFEYRSVGAAVRTLLRRRELPYRVEGAVRIQGPIGEIRVPLRKTGVLEP